MYPLPQTIIVVESSAIEEKLMSTLDLFGMNYTLRTNEIGELTILEMPYAPIYTYPILSYTTLQQQNVEQYRVNTAFILGQQERFFILDHGNTIIKIQTTRYAQQMFFDH